MVVAILAVAAAGFALSAFVFKPDRTTVTPPIVQSTPKTTPSTGPTTPAPTPQPSAGASATAPVPTPPAPASAAPPPALGTQEIFNKVEPGVVNVDSKVGDGTSEGTGMILTSSGEVLTNNHVINGALSTSVQLAATGQTYPAKVLNWDPTNDVAILQIQGASGLPTIPLGNSSDVKIGDSIVTLGNARGVNGASSTSQGNVVGLNRAITASDEAGGTSESLTGLIQIDATLEPGDSGGPLVNAQGQVVGMDTAASNRVRFSSSAGFAIPINTALAVAARLATTQPPATTGFLGVNVASITDAEQAVPGLVPPVQEGAYIVSVVPNSPAQSAGINSGDIIVSVNGTPITDPDALTARLAQDHAGDRVPVGWVDEQGTSHSATVTVTARPPD